MHLVNVLSLAISASVSEESRDYTTYNKEDAYVKRSTHFQPINST
jgi:hypothetical protein